MAIPANDPRIHHGVWRFRVSYYDADDGTDGRQLKTWAKRYRHGERLDGLPPRSTGRRPDGPHRL